MYCTIQIYVAYDSWALSICSYDAKHFCTKWYVSYNMYWVSYDTDDYANLTNCKLQLVICINNQISKYDFVFTSCLILVCIY